MQSTVRELSKATRLFVLQLNGSYELVSDGKDGTGTVGEIRKNGAVVFSGSCSACIEHAIKIGIWYTEPLTRPT